MKTEIRSTIHKYGELVEFTPKGGITLFLTASVQREALDPLVADASQELYTVYISAMDLTVRPMKFDRMKVRGRMTALDDDAVVESLANEPIAYVMRTMG